MKIGFVLLRDVLCVPSW